MSLRDRRRAGMSRTPQGYNGWWAAPMEGSGQPVDSITNCPPRWCTPWLGGRGPSSTRPPCHDRWEPRAARPAFLPALTAPLPPSNAPYGLSPTAGECLLESTSALPSARASSLSSAQCHCSALRSTPESSEPEDPSSLPPESALLSSCLGMLRFHSSCVCGATPPCASSERESTRRFCTFC